MPFILWIKTMFSIETELNIALKLLLYRVPWIVITSLYLFFFFTYRFDLEVLLCLSEKLLLDALLSFLIVVFPSFLSLSL